ncbi:MAG: hypothetical protein FWB75_02910 [Oscillospiraceae bacterium]|nr:hypothetical protein [Oscillospiraceae bacterium]
MKKKAIILMIVLSVMVTIVLTACNVLPIYPKEQIANTLIGDTSLIALSANLTFEETAEMATDVVIAQYVTRRPFGQNFTEFEFIVQERIFGNAADRIFVYVNHRISSSIMRADGTVDEPMFTDAAEYLLMLYRIDNVYSTAHEDGFWFISELVLDLSNPLRSTIYGEPLSQHSTGMNFNNRNLSREAITTYVRELTRNNTPSREPIRSNDIKDIIKASPHVLVVEINEPRRLAQYAFQSDFMLATDIFFTTVVRTLKGDREPGYVVRMVFFADTVQTGETHIIAAVPVTESNPYFYDLTSRYSLFRMDQLDEILEILGYVPEEPTPHIITIASGGIGAVASPEGAVLGQSVAINAGAAPAGRAFAGWTSGQGVVFADANAPSTTFAMIDEPVTVVANWEEAVFELDVTVYAQTLSSYYYDPDTNFMTVYLIGFATEVTFKPVVYRIGANGERIDAANNIVAHTDFFVGFYDGGWDVFVTATMLDGTFLSRSFGYGIITFGTPMRSPEDLAEY